MSLSEKFASNLQRLYETSEKQEAFFPWKKQAWEKFISVGLPTKKDETYAGFSLQKLFKENFVSCKKITIKKEQIENAIFPECKKSYAVFVNGFLDCALSDISGFSSHAVLQDLCQAKSIYGSFLQNHFSAVLLEEKDPFLLCNIAMQRNGGFLYVPPSTSAKSALQVLYVSTEKSAQNLFSTSSLHIVLGKKATCSVVSSSLSLGSGSYCHNNVIDFVLAEQAQCCYSHGVTYRENEWGLETICSKVKKGGCFSMTGMQLGSCGHFLRHASVLLEENAQAHTSILSLLGKAKRANLHIETHHKCFSTHSSQLVKNILAEMSSSSVLARVVIDKKAQNSTSKQMNRQLLLHESAKATSRPYLDVFTEDVKATHGVTTTTANEELLFYLQTRGIPLKKAKALYIEGFCVDILQKIPIETLREQMVNKVQTFIEKG